MHLFLVLFVLASDFLHIYLDLKMSSNLKLIYYLKKFQIATLQSNKLISLYHYNCHLQTNLNSMPRFNFNLKIIVCL